MAGNGAGPAPKRRRKLPIKNLARVSCAQTGAKAPEWVGFDWQWCQPRPQRALAVRGNAGHCQGTCRKTGAAGATSRAAPEGSRQPGKGWMVPRNAGSHPPSLVSHKVGHPRLQPVPRNAGSQTARHGWRWPRRAASRIPKAGINGKERDMRNKSQAKPSQEPSKPRGPQARSQRPHATSHVTT